MSGKVLGRCTSTKILGVTFDSKLTFLAHINSIISEAWRTLGFIIRMSKNFTNLKARKLLYNTFFRPKLKYASLVWSPTQLGQSIKIEKIQRKSGYYLPRGIANLVLCTECEYLTLDERRLCTEFSFATKLFNNLVDCPQLLAMFKFKAPSLGVRNRIPMYISAARTNFVQSAPIYRISDTVNRFCKSESSLDPLSCPTGYHTASLGSVAMKWR